MDSWMSGLGGRPSCTRYPPNPSILNLPASIHLSRTRYPHSAHPELVEGWAEWGPAMGYKAASRRWMPVAPLGRLPRCSSICGVPSNSAQRTSKLWSPAAKGQS